jgi:succinoglycan biosynthesis transport protein ExoP
LEDSERQLVAYAQPAGHRHHQRRQRHRLGGRTEQPIDAASLEAVNQALQQARTERITAEQRFRQAQVNRNTTEVLANPTVQTLTSQRAQLQAAISGEARHLSAGLSARWCSCAPASRRWTVRSPRRRATSPARFALSWRRRRRVRNALAQRFESLKSGLLNLRQRSIQYTILQREVDTNRALYDTLLQRYREVGVAGGVGQNVVSVVDRPTFPARRSSRTCRSTSCSASGRPGARLRRRLCAGVDGRHDQDSGRSHVQAGPRAARHHPGGREG